MKRSDIVKMEALEDKKVTSVKCGRRYAFAIG